MSSTDSDHMRQAVIFDRQNVSTSSGRSSGFLTYAVDGHPLNVGYSASSTARYTALSLPDGRSIGDGGGFGWACFLRENIHFMEFYYSASSSTGVTLASMTVTIYYQAVDRATLRAAKRAAKKNGDSVSRIAMEAIRKYAEKYYREVK